MERVRDPPVDRATRRDERLRRDEPPEDSGASVVRAEPAEEVDVEKLEIEPIQEAVE